jgi:putative endonuclease
VHSDKHFFVYITASRPRGVLYVGMTSDLTGRAYEHRERLIEGFTKRY